MTARSQTPLKALRELFGARLQENVVLANYTTAHVGGAADALLMANDANELELTVTRLWELKAPYVILGSGSNVLFSDQGYRGVVIINRARTIKIDTHGSTPTVWAESGANIGTLARQAGLRGLAGMEWAATIPGTVGGAVYGNAGAHGSDMAHNLMLADILHPEQGKVQWTAEQMEYSYRSSRLKRQPQGAVVLSARLSLITADRDQVQSRMTEFTAQRRRTQPPGASLGSMFKNPPGDYAGRLIEAAGLKGARVGGVEISTQHANFFINNENATAADIAGLINLARKTVAEKFGVQLELEVELLGPWDINTESSTGTQQ